MTNLPPEFCPDCGTAVNAAFWTPTAFENAEVHLREKYENPFWYPDLGRLHALALDAIA